MAIQVQEDQVLVAVGVWFPAPLDVMDVDFLSVMDRLSTERTHMNPDCG